MLNILILLDTEKNGVILAVRKYENRELSNRVFGSGYASLYHVRLISWLVVSDDRCPPASSG